MTLLNFRNVLPWQHKVLVIKGLHARRPGKKKRQLLTELPLPHPWKQGRAGVSLGLLRQVVTERRPHHVIDRVRPDCGPGRQASTARPGRPVEVGVLKTPLHSPLLALVELVPEAKGTFHDVSGITRASTTSGGCARASWNCLGRAT